MNQILDRSNDITRAMDQIDNLKDQILREKYAMATNFDLQYHNEEVPNEEHNKN